MKRSRAASARGSSKNRQRSSRHRRRLYWMPIALIGCLGIVTLRLELVQRLFGPKLLADAAKVEDVQSVLLAPRGAILDDEGHPLAYDLQAYQMDLHISKFPDVSALSQVVGQATGIPTNRVYTFFNSAKQSGASWIEWKYDVLEPQKEKLATGVANLLKANKATAKDDPGEYVSFTPTEQRFYPNGVFASNTIGFVNANNTGVTGLEAEYNSYLTGEDGKYEYTREADGFPVQSSIRVLQKAHPGDDVQLTLDQTIQGFVEQAMNGIVQQYHPAHAAIIVMDPNTGGILGISSRPTFDPNHYSTANPYALSSNWAVNEPFEPGSTFKAIVLTAALAANKISLNDTFESGHMRVDGVQINDWNWIGWGRLTFLGALEKSSNVGFATIALKLGWPTLLQYMKAFGFMGPTHVDLPNEGTSILFQKQNQGPVQLATSGFGQGIAVTPLQQMAAYAAIANGGKLLRPHLASAIINPSSGKVVKSFPPTVVNPQVAPPDALKQVNQGLIDDVNAPAGIDQLGFIPGYFVAGKTGTAQISKPGGGYYSNRFNVSFIGYAPGWAPRVEVYVTVSWPKTPEANTWGSTISTPIAKTILQECLEYYHIAPHAGDASIQPTSSQSTTTGTAAPTKTPKVSYVQTPEVQGQSLSGAVQRVKDMGLVPIVIGGVANGATVSGEWPESGIQVVRGSNMYLISTAIAKGQTVVMPDLTGVSLRAASNLLAALHLGMKASGDGYVSQQSVVPGQMVKVGTTVQVHCVPANNSSALTPSSNTAALQPTSAG